MSNPVLVVDTGVANLASLQKCLMRLGATSRITSEPSDIEVSDRIVLPGVGAFGPAMSSLNSTGVADAIRGAVESGSALLSICLGMQLLCEASDEAPGVPGLGLIPARSERFRNPPRIPQLGWNHVRGGAVVPGWAAFANSYRVGEEARGWTSSVCTYGEDFSAALRKGRILACQFHPELSGEWGAGVIERWLQDVEEPPTDDGAGGYACRIIPCLDVDEGRVVKGINFGNLRDVGDPAELAARYEAQGADEIVILDISATNENRDTARTTVEGVRSAIGIPLTVGGGVRSVDDARALLSAGADKVSINSAAITNPALISEIADTFGSQCCVLAIDARRTGPGWTVLSRGGRDDSGFDATAWAAAGEARGAGEILLTSWDRDGTGEGADIELLASVRRKTAVPIISSGGIGSASDGSDALRAGADAVLCASILHSGATTVSEIKETLIADGIMVRR